MKLQVDQEFQQIRIKDLNQQNNVEILTLEWTDLTKKNTRKKEKN